MAVKACATFLRLKKKKKITRKRLWNKRWKWKEHKSQSVIRQGECLITFIFDVDRRTQEKKTRNRLFKPSKVHDGLAVTFNTHSFFFLLWKYSNINNNVDVDSFAFEWSITDIQVKPWWHCYHYDQTTTTQCLSLKHRRDVGTSLLMPSIRPQFSVECRPYDIF